MTETTESQTTRLASILKKETETLRVQYVERCVAFAAKQYDIIVERATWNEVQWCEFLGLTPEKSRHGSHMTFPGEFYNTKLARKFRDLRDVAYSVRRQSVEQYKEQAGKIANMAYSASINKLAARILKKGLNIDALRVKTAHIGVNIESILTDGEKTVRAFTIIAEGPVQCPHYRYLIK